MLPSSRESIFPGTLPTHPHLLDSLKGASAGKLEQVRLEVENCEDDLVQKTEVAITMMKALLDNVSDTRYSWIIV